VNEERVLKVIEMTFRDRIAAGRALGHRLQHLRDTDAVVLGVSRGGVPVAFEVARALRLPLDVIVVRKVGVPSDPELAMGAVGEDGATIVNTGVVAASRVSDAQFTFAVRQARAELDRRVDLLRGGRPGIPLAGRTAIIVDDGMATGATARAACQIARGLGAARVVMAVPVAARDAAATLSAMADEVVCLCQPSSLVAVGRYYDDFTPTGDAEVAALLKQTTRPAPPTEEAVTDPSADVEATISSGDVSLDAQVNVPPNPRGAVIIAHVSGNGRRSPRNRVMARLLRQPGLATVLLDLLVTGEATDRRNAFDIALLADRLADTVRWVRRRPDTANLPIGLFGAGTGAAAALLAATDPDLRIAAVVSRGGHLDQVWEQLPHVTAPTLLIVGGRDPLVLDVNRRAEARLRGPKRLAVVPGAGHLFGEPGALYAVAELAEAWYVHYLRDESSGRARRQAG
jgi:putative phosphoribosyl transferase